MSKERSSASEQLTKEHIERYLCRRYGEGARVQELRLLGQERQEDLKGYGYGRPLRIQFAINDGSEKVIVLRTMSPDPFGHERRADRAANLIESFDTFNDIPQHIHALDIGTFSAEGELCSMAPGEAFFVTDYVDGELYAHDLARMSKDLNAQHASPLDTQRSQVLASYLARLHRQKVDPACYVREIRDTIGSGEGVFGLCDSYPANHSIATPLRLMHIEQKAVEWRWKLKQKTHRASRTHGDFHPFNILFREGTDLTLLDCSRGGVGEPADDLTSLSLNYLFFALQQRPVFDGPLRECWDIFWQTYLQETDDIECCEVVAPFFAWRALVMASPLWYPSIREAVREQLLTLAERLLDGHPFHPEQIDEVLR